MTVVRVSQVNLLKRRRATHPEVQAVQVAQVLFRVLANQQVRPQVVHQVVQAVLIRAVQVAKAKGILRVAPRVHLGDGIERSHLLWECRLLIQV